MVSVQRLVDTSTRHQGMLCGGKSFFSLAVLVGLLTGCGGAMTPKTFERYSSMGTVPSAETSDYKVTLLSPVADSTVQGNVFVSGIAPGFLNIEILNSSGDLVSRATPDADGSFATVIDTTQLSNGPQTLTVYGWDSSAGQPFTHTDQVSLNILIANATNPMATPVPTLVPTPQPTPAGTPTPDVGSLPAPIAGMNYHMTFNEEFSTLSVSNDLSGGARWYPSQPPHVAGDGYGFGASAFVPASGSGNPFAIVNDMLQITAREVGNNFWNTGLLSSIDPRGHGFAQKYGYFEMRAKFPAGVGTWPAFWLDSLQAPGEIDVVEEYGAIPTTLYFTLHDWGNGHRELDATRQQVADMTAGFHTYGLLWTASTMTVYFDGKKIYQTATPSIFNVPYYIMINLAMGGNVDLNQAPSQPQMLVDYVRAYSNQ